MNFKINKQVNKGILSLNIVASVLLLLLSFFSISTIYLLNKYSLLPGNLRLKISLLIVFIALIPVLLLLISKRAKTVKIIAIILSLLLSLALVAGNFYLNRTFKAINSLSSDRERDNKSFAKLFVLKDSKYNSVDELNGKKVIAPIQTDQAFIQEFINALNSNIEVYDSGTYPQAVKELLDKTADAIIINSNWLDLLEESIPNFKDKFRLLYELEVNNQSNSLNVNHDDEKIEDKNWPNVPFNIYLSGIDSYGEIETVSRSDVNIILSMNPNSKKILLTSIPRDTYCQIPDGGANQYDKLTHAGIYGAKTSMRALNDLLDINTSRYVKINFSGLIEVVDSLGGVDVDNPNSFNTGDYNFPEGKVHLDGKMALAFCRERNSFVDGDFERGRNQERVLKAIVKKLSSPTIIVNYSQILSSIENSIETNFSTDEIMKIVNLQLENGFDWNIEMQALSGTGHDDLPSYLMPGWSLYVMVPDESSLAEVKRNIREVLGN